MLQPNRGKMLVLDSTDFEPRRYKEFISILNMLAKFLSSTFASCKIFQKNYIYKLTSYFFLFKTGLTCTTFPKEEFIPPERTTEMNSHTHFPCNKQPVGFVYCAYYMCEHMSELGRYTTDPERVSG
jgi:hypothetical protein